MSSTSVYRMLSAKPHGASQIQRCKRCTASSGGTTLTSISICRACRSKIPQIRAPHTLKRMTCHGETNDSWISYPSPGEQIEAHTGCVFNSLCDLNIILSEFSPLKEGEEEETRELMIRLQTWFEDLPSCIRDNGRMPPHILSLL